MPALSQAPCTTDNVVDMRASRATAGLHAGCRLHRPGARQYGNVLRCAVGGGPMKRRTAAAMLGGAALALPLGARAQRADKVHRIGFVSPTARGSRSDAFLQGLRELGYVEGHNVKVEMRFAEGLPERLPGLVDELLRLQVEVLVVGATIGARAAKRATTSVPKLTAKRPIAFVRHPGGGCHFHQGCRPIQGCHPGAGCHPIQGCRPVQGCHPIQGCHPGAGRDPWWHGLSLLVPVFGLPASRHALFVGAAAFGGVQLRIGAA